MRLTTFCQIWGDAQAEALVNTMHPSQAKLGAQKARDTLCDVEAGESADKLADRLPKVKADKVGEMLTDVKSALLL